jgi:uncharacterized protein (TIGR02996 family)
MSWTAEALLRTVRASPQDAGARLVYADYLEEAGLSEEADWWREESHWTETAVATGHGGGVDGLDGLDGRGGGYGYGYGGYGYGGGGYGYGGGGGDGGDGYGYGDGDGDGGGGYDGGGGVTELTKETIVEGMYILVCDNGFVLVGEVSPDPGDHLRAAVTKCAVVRRFGTDRGLGQLALEGPRPNTTLDPTGGDVSALRGWIKLAIPCDRAAWRAYLDDPRWTLAKARTETGGEAAERRGA